MQLTDILNQDFFFDTVVCYNRSSKYFSLMLNLIRKKYGIQASDMFLLQNLSELKQLEGTLVTAPLFSSAWLVYIEDSSMGILPKELMEIVRKSQRLVLVVGFKNYANFSKMRKDSRWKSRFLETVYASNLTQDEFDFIYQATISVKGASTLTDELQTFLKKGYLRQPEAVFEVFSALKNGIKFKTKADIIQIAGLGSISPEFEVLSLLTSTVKTERGLKTFMKKHSTTVLELVHRQKPLTVYTAFRDSILSILNVRQLISEGLLISGVTTQVDLEAYQTPRVRTFVRRADKIEGIPTSKIVHFLDVLTSQGAWSTEVDALRFLESYAYQLLRMRGIM